MLLNEPLHIEAPVSPRLFTSSHKIQTLLSNWHPALNKIQVEAEAGQPDRKTSLSSARGVFFSLGVDSFYTLLKNIQQDEESITHLVTVEGFDVYLWESGRYPAVLENFKRVADKFGKSAVRVTTNLRDFSDRVVNWPDVYHGAALASIGLMLQNFFSKMYIAASRVETDLRPLGTHPLLDPLWSTDQISFTHDGREASRPQKIHRIAESQIALETVRVCAITEDSEVYNCGKCAKCLLTMVGFHIAGALKECQTLPDEIDVDRLANISPHGREYTIQHFIDALGESVEDRVLKDALKHCLRTEAKVTSATA